MNAEIHFAERKVAEQALQESEQRYKRLLASTADYVYTVTVDRGRSVATSHGPGCEAVTGYASREFGANPSLWSRMIYDEDRPAVLTWVAHILKGELAPPLEHRIVHRDGNIRWIQNTPIPHRDNQGRVVAYDGQRARERSDGGWGEPYFNFIRVARIDGKGFRGNGKR